MSQLDSTLASLAPGITFSKDLPGRYNPRHGLAIYCLPLPGYSPSAPGVVLGEALAARSGLGCTLLEGIPEKVPEGAVVVAQYAALKATREELLENIPEPKELGQYAIKLGRFAVITSPSQEGLAAGMQTLSMLVLRHNDDFLPGAVVLDSPLAHYRCLAVELQSGEIGVNLLMQIASFAATFKANSLHLILDEDFDPAREIPGVETFAQSCASYGIALGVRLPWLGGLISGKRTLLETWSGLRAAVRAFGAVQAGLDDPCPPDTPIETVYRVVDSIRKGDVGVANFCVDARLLHRSEVSPGDLRALGVSGWHRLADSQELPPVEYDDMPLRIDVEGPLPGLSGRGNAAYHRRLGAAMNWLREQKKREMVVSFRHIGISHMWQNLLYPAATGLIAAWGKPDTAKQCAWLFSNLLYGEAAMSVMRMWDDVNAAFPTGLAPASEVLLRQTAFGRWPEDEEARTLLAGVNWPAVAKKIMAAAESLKNTAQGLIRNVSTLTGAKLSLQTLSWLHSFASLLPELERRRASKDDADGRTEAIAAELYSNFQTWQASLQELYGESGLEISEMPQVESMGLRLKGLCEGIFE